VSVCHSRTVKVCFSTHPKTNIYDISQGAIWDSIPQYLHHIRKKSTENVLLFYGFVFESFYKTCINLMKEDSQYTYNKLG
jgi:hypothetical protein